MRAVNVPDQITTTEDKGAGNLSLQQLILLVIPLFLGTALYTVVPHMFEIDLYKVIIFLVTALLCVTASLRIKGTLLVYWVVLIIRYKLRPRTYVYDKSDTYMKQWPTEIESDDKATEATLPKTQKVYRSISEVSHTKSQKFAQARARYSINKGGLNVVYVEKQ